MVNVIPGIIKNITGYIKDNFENNTKIIIKFYWTSWYLIKFFAQDKIDSYFNKITKKIIKNFGTDIYLNFFYKLEISRKKKDDIVINEVDSKSINSLLLDT